MIEVLALLRTLAQSRDARLSPEDEKTALEKIRWQHAVCEAAKKADEPWQPAVERMVTYLTCGSPDGIARMYANQMIGQYRALLKRIEAQAPPGERTGWEGFASVEEWLRTLNYLVQRAPRYSGQQFPMSSLFVFFMFTPSGAALLREKAFNERMTAILQCWCVYLDSTDSLDVLAEPDGWLSESAQQSLCLHQSVNWLTRDEPLWGFQSFNAFFHREFQLDKYRPMDGEGDPRVVVSPNDGTVYRIARDVRLCDRFWTKGQPYSLSEMLVGSPYIESFVGGDVLQSFLAGSDYHRWHAPIAGTVKEARVIPGLTFSELLSEGLDLSAGTLSQGWEAMVNTRGLIVIESPELGKKVAMLPIGITEISSVTLSISTGDRVEKGQELGYFSYGGSSLALVFEKDMIESFTARYSEDPPQPTCKTVEDCKASEGCLRVRAEVARAR